jgi:hypothetical protein
MESPPHSPLPEDIPLLGDIFSQQVGISVGARRPRRPHMKTGPLTGLPSQPYLTLVSPDLQGMSVVAVVTVIDHLLGALQVPLSSPTARVVAAMVAGPSSSGSGGAEPPSKRVCPWSFLLVSSWYAHCVVCWFTQLPLLMFLF